FLVPGLGLALQDPVGRDRGGFELGCALSNQNDRIRHRVLRTQGPCLDPFVNSRTTTLDHQPMGNNQGESLATRKAFDYIRSVGHEWLCPNGTPLIRPANANAP